MVNDRATVLSGSVSWFGSKAWLQETDPKQTAGMSVKPSTGVPSNQSTAGGSWLTIVTVSDTGPLVSKKLSLGTNQYISKPWILSANSRFRIDRVMIS